MPRPESILAGRFLFASVDAGPTAVLLQTTNAARRRTFRQCQVISSARDRMYGATAAYYPPRPLPGRREREGESTGRVCRDRPVPHGLGADMSHLDAVGPNGKLRRCLLSAAIIFSDTVQAANANGRHIQETMRTYRRWIPGRACPGEIDASMLVPQPRLTCTCLGTQPCGRIRLLTPGRKMVTGIIPYLRSMLG